MERQYYKEGKQHQSQSSRTSSLRSKALQTEDSVMYAPTTSYSEEDIHSFNNDVSDILRKPNHYSTVTGYLNAQVGKRKYAMKTATRKLDLNTIKRQRRHLCRLGNIKKYKIIESHV